DRAQRHVGPLELVLQLLPDVSVAERLLGRAKQARERGEALAFLPAPGAARAALDVRGETALDPGALRALEREGGCGQDDEGDEQRDHEPAEWAVERLWQTAARGGSGGQVAGYLEVRRSRALGRERDAQVQLVARPRRGHVLDPPGAA